VADDQAGALAFSVPDWHADLVAAEFADRVIFVKDVPYIEFTFYETPDYRWMVFYKKHATAIRVVAEYTYNPFLVVGVIINISEF
jgi:hypothetical protein